MRRPGTWLVAWTVAVLVAGLAWQFTRLPLLEVTTVKAEPVERVLAAVGRVRAGVRVAVFARTGGQIVELHKHEGDSVVTGEVLGLLDARQPRAAMTQRLAVLASQRLQLKQSRRELLRAQSMQRRGFTTDAKVEAARLSVEHDQGELARLEAAVTEADSRVEDFVIRAPMDGRILLRSVDPGQVVDARTEIFELASEHAPEVETDVDEAVAGALHVGMRARLSPVGMKHEILNGRVTFVAPRVDAATGGRTIRLWFDTPPKEIPPGLSVDVNIVVETFDRALTLPRRAIGESESRPYVMLVRDNTVVKRHITFIDWPAERVVVTSGLKQGDHVAADPFAADENSGVRPVAASEAR